MDESRRHSKILRWITASAISAASFLERRAQHGEIDDIGECGFGRSAGEPIEEDGDLFGKAVQLAARLCAHAEPARILVAQLVLDQCQGKGLPFSDLGEITPKGFDRAIPVYVVKWMEA